MLSSIGFHTLMLSSWLVDAEQLIEDFRTYSKETGDIQMYMNRQSNTVVKFHLEDKGIEWLIRYNVWDNRSQTLLDYIYVTINPKILSGVKDYTTAATMGIMNKAVSNFNDLCKTISSELPVFEKYRLIRVDYCLNFALNELAPNCTAEQVMELIKRSNIPPRFREWMKYDPISHRKKSMPGSFYLMSQSIHINCYSKYMQLLDRQRKNIERGYAPVPQQTLNKARDIIRFEIQCHYIKTYNLSAGAKKSGYRRGDIYKSLLAPEQCIDQISKYFNKTIGKGDWYTLQEAIRKVEHCGYSKQRERRLIDALQLVNQCRSVPSAISCYDENEQGVFQKTLRELSGIGINPVTIPKGWGIRHIPNLLYAYFDKVEGERQKEEWSVISTELVKEHIAKYGI